jgi:glutathione S-transferase
MRSLYHLPISPFCRKIRLVLAEKRLDVSLIEEKPWERRQELLMMNPASQVPVLLDHAGGPPLADSMAIFEYLEETYPEIPLLPATPLARAETRRLMQWFDVKFHQEVTMTLLYERTYKRLKRTGAPNSTSIRLGAQNLKDHLQYISWLVYRRNWLVGDRLTIADFTAAAHISALDYAGEIDWKDSDPAKHWYARIKSRPAFRELLGDHIPGMPAAPHYADLDF